MKKKILISSIVTIILLSMSFLVLTACNDKDPKPREVILEVINPNNGEVMISGSTRIDLPKEKTYVEVRIKDKETDKYLTDDDLPENTVKGSYHTGIEVVESGSPLYTYGYCPLEIDPIYDYYEIAVYFDCKPKSIIDSKFQRKYKTTTDYIRFYVNR